MTPTDPWWPPGTDSPAFQVQRQPYGAIIGGDYVRARIATVPDEAALPPAASVELGELRITLDTNHLWRVEDVAGTPTWVDNGVAPVQALQTALRYTTQVKGWEEIKDHALLVVRPYDYSTMQLTWGWPKNMADTWLEVALVRSGFGRPTTPNDGVTIFRETRETMLIDYSADGVNVLGPIVYDRNLPNGRWYYYTVFFRTSPLDWVAGMQMGSPLPRNYHHNEHLWNHLPPWYQYSDDNLRESDGFLRQFLDIFGFELDLTREYIEQWQQLYHIDFCPMRLLRKLGENFNVAYESGLGDIRYRGLVGNIAHLYDERGTAKGLQHLIEAASQYQCEITQGDNIMLTPEDSEFLTGTGHWSPLHPHLFPTTHLPTGEYNNQTTTTLATTKDIAPPPGEGRGVMVVTTYKEGSPGGALANFAIDCGAGISLVSGPEVDGVYSTVEKEVLPLYAGIAVKEDVLYGFSIWVKEPNPVPTRAGVMWFGPDGQIKDFLAVDESLSPITPSDTDWHQYTVQASPPAGAYYLVPYVLITDTLYDRSVYFAGALIYALGESGVVTPFAPDQYLTIGDPSEKLGVDDAQGGGYLLGAPE